MVSAPSTLPPPTLTPQRPRSPRRRAGSAHQGMRAAPPERKPMRIASFAVSSSGPGANASCAMNSAIVKPMPRRFRRALTCAQRIPRRQRHEPRRAQQPREPDDAERLAREQGRRDAEEDPRRRRLRAIALPERDARVRQREQRHDAERDPPCSSVLQPLDGRDGLRAGDVSASQVRNQRVRILAARRARLPRRSSLASLDGKPRSRTRRAPASSGRATTPASVG